MPWTARNATANKRITKRREEKVLGPDHERKDYATLRSSEKKQTKSKRV